MPCLVRILSPHGLQAAPYTAESLADAAHHEPHDGVYTVTNTVNTYQVLKLTAHLDRLEDSARRENMGLNLNRARLREGLRTLITEAGWGDVRFRITIPKMHPDQIILSVEPFKPQPAAVYEKGVRCITLTESSRHNPSAKTTGWMHDRENLKLPEGIFTGLLLDPQGNILEGTTSNFYAVLDGELRTAGEGVLPGIARQVVYEVASAIIPLKAEAVNVADLGRLSEAFITSSSRGIMPVVEIDGVQIGDGVPGVKTQALRQVYQAWVEGHLEML